MLGNHADIALVSFPVKPRTVVFDGSNVVEHAKDQFRQGDVVPGFYAKADPALIVASAHALVAMADTHPYWGTILVPRFGCGAGELSWDAIKPLVETVLDDRFIACTF